MESVYDIHYKILENLREHRISLQHRIDTTKITQRKRNYFFVTVKWKNIRFKLAPILIGTIYDSYVY